MTAIAPPFKFDEIGYWSELKLEIVEKYGSAYTKAFARTHNLKKYYIDAFSGAGVHVSKRTREQVDGSPSRALKVSPSFDGFYFIDMDADKTAYLRRLCQDRKDVHIHTGDSTRISLLSFCLLSSSVTSTEQYACLIHTGYILNGRSCDKLVTTRHRYVFELSCNGYEFERDLAQSRGGTEAVSSV